MSKKVTVIVEGREYIVEVGDLTERPIRATVNQKTYQVQVPSRSGQAKEPKGPSAKSAPAPTPVRQEGTPAAPTDENGSVVTAPLPGDIVEVKVMPGDSVQPGDVVCVLEAMKMKNMIRSPQAGVIATVEVSPGQSVDYGTVLVTFE